jgi:hypothetical protein
VTYAFTIGTYIQGLGHEGLEESNFPLLQFTKAVSSISRSQDFENMRQWVEGSFIYDEYALRQMPILINYTETPAVHEQNHELFISIQSILQCALMCYWNSCLG